MAVATDKTRYKDVKVRIPEEELAVLNCRVAKTGMSREQYIRCLIADTIPAEYPPADYRLIIRKLDELQETMDALVEENPIRRDAMKLYITLQNVASTADMLRRAVVPSISDHPQQQMMECLVQWEHYTHAAPGFLRKLSVLMGVLFAGRNLNFAS